MRSTRRQFHAQNGMRGARAGAGIGMRCASTGMCRWFRGARAVGRRSIAVPKNRAVSRAMVAVAD